MLSGEEKEAVRKMALDLSLKYSFVTPLTSMVVNKPEGEDTLGQQTQRGREASTFQWKNAWHIPFHW